MPRKDAEQTRRNLLSAGSEIFAAKGYRDTTIAEICERAGANIAAINYHFNDKETLYRESWRHAFLRSIETYPLDGGVSDGAGPEERLRGLVGALLRRIADQDNREFSITLKEIANPTGLLKDLLKDDLRPLRVRLESVVRELLDVRASETRVRFCGISIMTQCINGIVAGLTTKQGLQDEDGRYAIDNIDYFIDHVVRFSLGGIAAIRETAGKSD